MERTYNIVIVDNDPVYLGWLCNTVKTITPEARCFTEPSIALAYMEENPPTLLIMKIDMPRLDGSAMCEIMRRSDKLKSVPIVLISGDTTIGDFSLYFKGVDFFSKSKGSAHELIGKVNMYCNLKQAQDLTDGIH